MKVFDSVNKNDIFLNSPEVLHSSLYPPYFYFYSCDICTLCYFKPQHNTYCLKFIIQKKQLIAINTYNQPVTLYKRINNFYNDIGIIILNNYLNS